MLCYNCFKDYSGTKCPYCGYDPSEQAGRFPHALKPGTVLKGLYTVGRVLGQGGFGITYIGHEIKTGRLVAIKEYFPESYSMRSQGSDVIAHSGKNEEYYSYGKESFYSEAQTIYKFKGNPHIVQVYAYFEENNTAYIVMEFIHGTSLDKMMKQRGGRISVQDADRILLPLVDVLDAIHSQGLVHRDIAPDNVLVDESGITKLIDFGASRFSIGEKTQTLTMILKHGYAPFEQYQSKGHQGPFTDLYAFAAMYYHTITGIIPPQSTDRIVNDELRPPSAYGINLGKQRESALMKALSVSPKNRQQNMQQFKKDFVPIEFQAASNPAYAGMDEPQKEMQYQRACAMHRDRQYEAAAALFDSLGSYKDSRIKGCDCELNLGKAYYYGDGIKEDYPKAAEWFRKAAIKGNPEAQYRLGYMYANGAGLPMDIVKAKNWLQNAATHGNAEAINMLNALNAAGGGGQQGGSSGKKNSKLITALLIAGAVLIVILFFFL